MRHELKIKKPFADAVVEGRKTFELRYNDRGFQVGDTIQFTAMTTANGSYCADSKHPINGREYEITYVLGGWGLTENWVALAIRELLRGEGAVIDEPDTIRNELTDSGLLRSDA